MKDIVFLSLFSKHHEWGNGRARPQPSLMLGKAATATLAALAALISQLRVSHGQRPTSVYGGALDLGLVGLPSKETSFSSAKEKILPNLWSGEELDPEAMRVAEAAATAARRSPHSLVDFDYMGHYADRAMGGYGKSLHQTS
jgi:hypothetical protein